MTKKSIPPEALVDLRRRLNMFPPRSNERRALMQKAANLFGISEITLYRALREQIRPKSLRRSDYGKPRVISAKQMEHYCEIIAAMKIKTSNKKGRHLSTSKAIHLLESFGVDTPDGFIKSPKSVLKISTVNRYLKKWGYDRNTLKRQPPSVRFQAQYSNQCWHFDLSVSDLKYLPKPPWFKEQKGRPLLMLYSIVDDRSGVVYQEYHCVYGEDVEAALKFLFNAMTKKENETFPFQGIPEMIYMDRGPIYRSHVFQQVMEYLGISVKAHMPANSDGRRITARSKGKVERPFRTVKELHETLYHFHKPQDEGEANEWLMNFLLRYNDMQHRSKSHSRMEDWIIGIPNNGIREMCSWDRFCTFARQPEKRKVGNDARVSAGDVLYEVDPDLTGEDVILWWGIFDHELYVEHGERRYGPYAPVGGPIPLGRYRKFRKTETQKRADRVEELAEKLMVPKAAVAGNGYSTSLSQEMPRKASILFSDPDPFQEFTFPSVIDAKLAIADHLGIPLAKLPDEQLQGINEILADTLKRDEVFKKVEMLLKTTKER